MPKDQAKEKPTYWQEDDLTCCHCPGCGSCGLAGCHAKLTTKEADEGLVCRYCRLAAGTATYVGGDVSRRMDKR